MDIGYRVRISGIIRNLDYLFIYNFLNRVFSKYNITMFSLIFNKKINKLSTHK
jgi:hypothetical protein